MCTWNEKNNICQNIFLLYIINYKYSFALLKNPSKF